MRLARKGRTIASPLLATKFYVPVRRRGLVPRPRLIERLRRGAESKLTLVSAPAGFGKTTLLAEWLAAAPAGEQSAAWLSLDQSDNRPATFWTVMELILVGTAIGTAVGLFPILRRYNESIALGHLCFRFLEAVLITIGIVGVLALLTLSQEFVAAAAPDVTSFQASGRLLIAVHDWTFMLGPKLMLGVNTLMYSYLLYKSRLVPRPLATLGLTGATLVTITAFLQMFGVVQEMSSAVILLSLMVAAYEMIPAGWLIVKGFNSSATAPAPARTATSKLLSAA